MDAPTLLLDSALQVATAIMYAYVGYVITRRPTTGDARLATNLFATWWVGLALTTLGGVANRVLGYLHVTDVALYTTITYAVFLALMISLWGLLYYLLYLFTGTRRWLWPVTAFYVALYVYTLYLIAVAKPIGVKVQAWSVTMEYANQPTGWTVVVFFIALLVPILLGAIGYARLYFRVEGRTPRYRIGMVSSTFVLWFGSSLVVTILQTNTSPAWQVMSRFIGLAAAVAIYFAYRPPAWVRARYGIRAIDEEPALTS